MKTTEAKSQIQLAGKTYEAKVKYVCKKMANGGCAITTYCVLTFSKETVTVHYYAKAACEPKDREADYSYDGSDEKETYRWIESGNVVTIKGFSEYGTYLYRSQKLIGSRGDFDEAAIEFVEK
ncbi:MAG: hypothetical protein JSS93_01945 [Bacteroidetes bacterium]|nr:hypothetical protein [Bacteroidota bacterium]